MLVPLHVRSDLSLGSGTASIEEWAARAHAQGYRVLALADVETLAGQVRLHRACRERGLRPLTGLELRDESSVPAAGPRAAERVVLWAQDESGWRSLCAIVAERRGAVEPGGTLDAVACVGRHPDGILAVVRSADAVAALVAVLGSSRVRLAVVRPCADPAAERSARSAADRFGVALLADTDTLLPEPDAAALHRLQAAVRGVPPEPDADLRRLHPPDQVEALFADVPEALANAVVLGAAATLDLLGRPSLAPPVTFAPGEDAAGALGRAARTALAECVAQGRCRTDEHFARLEHELALVARLGWSAHLLAVVEIATLAAACGIDTCLRGSAGASFLLHVLGVSALDPVAHGLLFERFLHAERDEPPDVDLDVAADRRMELIEAVRAHYGPDRVALVSSVVAFGPRSALREGLKALGWAPARVEALLHALPPDDLPQALEEALRALARADPDVALAGRLVGRPRLVAAHPGGVVLAERPLADVVPLERTPRGVVVSQLDLDAVAAVGLVKIDLLGNRALSALRAARAGAPAWPDPWEDAATLAALREARTVGCFQLESAPVRAVLARLAVQDLAGAAAALAVVRPGAASGAAKDAYVRRARGEEAEPPMPALVEPVLRRTHGVLLYEEQAIELIARACGVGRARADALRRAIRRAGTGTEEDARPLRDDLLARAERGGLAPAEAGALWATLWSFATYAFCEAHALAYARLGLQVLQAKVHRPAALAAGLLDHHGGAYPLRVVAAEMRRAGVTLLAPHVNCADLASRVEPGQDRAVRVGLARVRGLRGRSATAIVRERAHRPFASLEELEQRGGLLGSEVDALVRAGGLDGLAPLEPGAEFARASTVSTRAGEAFLLRPSGNAEQAGRLARLLRARDELRVLGFCLADHPVAILRPEAERLECVASTALAAAAGRRVRFVGLVAALRTVPRLHGGFLRFATLEDEHGFVEATLRSTTLDGLASLAGPGPYLLEGMVRGDPLRIDVERASPFHHRPDPWPQPAATAPA